MKPRWTKWMFVLLAGGRIKQNKKSFPLPSMLSYESLMSVKENTDRKRKKEKKIRIEHKPNGTLLTFDIMYKYCPNNS